VRNKTNNTSKGDLKMSDIKVISVYAISNFGGIEILNVEYDIDDRIVYRYNFGQPENKIHKARIYYGAGDMPYFNTKFGRIYLKDCMRV
jgi:hypothetical protein